MQLIIGMSTSQQMELRYIKGEFMEITYTEVLSWWRIQNPKTIADLNQILYNFRILFACNSSAIEGVNVSYHTTREIFEDDKVSSYSGDLTSLMEMRNQKFASEYIVKAFEAKKPLNVQMIKKVHRLLLYGCYDEKRWNKGERPGEFKKGDYCVGIDNEGSLPEEVVTDLEELLDEVHTYGAKDHLVAASYFHLKFEQIHPFADGNGRVGRTLLNYYLMCHGYPPAVLYNEDKETYYMALTVYDKTGNIDGFTRFLQEQTVKTWETVISRHRPTSHKTKQEMLDYATSKGYAYDALCTLIYRDLPSLVRCRYLTIEGAALDNWEEYKKLNNLIM